MTDRKTTMASPQENGSEITNLQPEFPPGMAPKMLKLVNVLNDLEKKLEPLISKPHHQVLNKLTPQDRAKVGLMEVYAINSLFWVLMRTTGEDVDQTLRDDYKLEMGRLKETQGKLAELEARAHRRGVDVQAASRFIHRGLGINQNNRRDESMEQNSSGYFRQERKPQHIHFNQSNGEKYEEVDGDTSYHNEDSPAQTSSMNKKKKNNSTNMRPPSYKYFDDTGNNTSGYQASGEDSLLPTPPPQKLAKKKKKNATKLNNSESLNEGTPESAPKKKKKKANKLDPGKKLKKKKLKGPNAGENSKKRKMTEDSTAHPNEEALEDINEDNKDAAKTLTKKKKKQKKNKQVTTADIASFLDVTRGQVNYEISKDERGKEWYEQGWT